MEKLVVSSSIRRGLCACVGVILSYGIVFADSGESWTFAFDTSRGASENIYGFLTSGNWKLKARVASAGSTEVWLSDTTWADRAAYVSGDGILDLTVPIYNGNRQMTLTKVLRTAFQNMNVSVTRLVLPETIDEIATYAFSNASAIDKLIVRSSLVTALPERAFQGLANVSHLELAFPSLPSSSCGSQALLIGTVSYLSFDATGWGAIGTWGPFNRKAAVHLAPLQGN